MDFGVELSEHRWAPIVNGTDCMRGHTLLHWAVHGDDLPLLADLLGAGWAADVQDYEGWTAVHLATASGRPELVRAFLAEAPGLEALGLASAETKGIRSGFTPLHLATGVVECCNHAKEPYVPGRETRDRAAWRATVEALKLLRRKALDSALLEPTRLSQISAKE